MPASFLPVELKTVGLAIGLIAASFLLAWAADAGEAVFSGGLVLAVIALVAVLPEFIIEVRFAYVQQTELVTANLTGATGLLLTGAIALPLGVAFITRRRGQAGRPPVFADISGGLVATRGTDSRNAKSLLAALEKWRLASMTGVCSSRMLGLHRGARRKHGMDEARRQESDRRRRAHRA